MKIYNVYSEVIFEDDSTTIKETVETAVAAGVSLQFADLSGAYLRGADLSGAYLRGIYLRGANLCVANLSGADLREVDLSGANLCETYLPFANLSGADLYEVNLRGADLRDAILPEGIPVIPNIHQAVYEAASKPDALDMSDWHTCETTHCRAGWVVTLAGEEGQALENKFGTGAAAALIYTASDPTLEKIPDWTCSNISALEDMERLATQ